MKPNLMRLYRKMSGAYGPMEWWPGETPWEIMVGAILTQNTAWSNVEKAIRSLKAEGALGIKRMRILGPKALAPLIRSSGYYNQKAEKIARLIAYLDEKHGGSIDTMGKIETAVLRDELLGIKGIGPETADSILLYALGQPTFVIDAYTRRILARHGVCAPNASYEELQALFMERIEPDVNLYNEYHALLVRTGNRYCKKRNPECGECPLGDEKSIDKAMVI